jgi:DNA-binding NarL/FixJ family response regulator
VTEYADPTAGIPGDIGERRPVRESPERFLRKILTARQLEVLRLVSQGLTNEAISEQLAISTSSVVNHLSQIYSVLDIPQESNPRVQATLDYLTSTGQLSFK